MRTTPNASSGTLPIISSMAPKASCSLLSTSSRRTPATDAPPFFLRPESCQAAWGFNRREDVVRIGALAVGWSGGEALVLVGQGVLYPAELEQPHGREGEILACAHDLAAATAKRYALGRDSKRSVCMGPDAFGNRARCVRRKVFALKVPRDSGILGDQWTAVYENSFLPAGTAAVEEVTFRAFGQVGNDGQSNPRTTLPESKKARNLRPGLQDSNGGMCET